MLHEVPEFARSVGHLYVASDLTVVPTRRDEGEATMTTAEYSEAELREMVTSGAIQSVTVQAALYHYLEHSGRVQQVEADASMRMRMMLGATLVGCAVGALAGWRAPR